MKSNRNFVPTRHIWVILTNSSYSEKRKIEKFANFNDLPEVIQDAAIVRQGFLGLGANTQDIKSLSDVDHS